MRGLCCGLRRNLYRVAALVALNTWAPFALAQNAIEWPALTDRVVDYAELLSTKQESTLIAQLAAHEAETSNQIVVATVPDLQGAGIADYANRLARHWQLGTAENDNGILLLVAPNEREVRIEVGYGLEGAVPDALAGVLIRREILPRFKRGDYAGGIQRGVDALLRAVAGEYEMPDNEGRGTLDFNQAFIPAIFIGLVGLMELLRRTGRHRAARGAFPAGFGGLMASLVSGHWYVGVGVAIGLFALIFFLGKPGSGGGGTGTRRGRSGRYLPGSGGFGGGGFGGGGGFSGGGGGFGGGGASGGW